MIKIHHRRKSMIELNRLFFYLVPSSRWQVRLKTQVDNVLFSDDAVIFCIVSGVMLCSD